MANLPTVSSNIPRDLRAFLDRVREALSSGTPDGVVTARQLVAAGIAQYSGGSLVGVVGAGVTPTRPKNVTASGALANIMVTWDKPTYQGHAFAEIWAASRTAAQEAATPKEDPTIGQAELVGMAPGTFFAHNVGAAAQRWYWVRFVNFAGTVGPYQGTEGIFGETSLDPAYILEVLTGEITASQLATSLSSRIDKIDGPATTVGTVAYQLADLQGQVNELLNLPTWDSTETYAIDDQIVYEGFLYVAVAASTNVEPGTDDTKWEEIGEYATIGDAVAAHTTQINTLDSELGQEVIDRTTLASQVRGNYTGTDVSLLTQGLLYNERVARSNADSALATDISTVTALANSKQRTFYQNTQPTGTTADPLRVGDMWVNTDLEYADDYVAGTDYAIRSNRVYRWDGSDWVEAMDYGFADFFSALRTEKTARVDEDSALAQQITTLTSATNGSLASINQTLSTHTSDISANSGLITALGTAYQAADQIISANLQTEINARSSADEALSESITTLTASIGPDIAAAVQQEATARANADGTIEAKYTVKVDVAGHVSGYGLIADNNTGTPASEFGIRADSFWLAPPTNTDSNAPTENLYPGYVWLQNGDPDTYDTKYWTGSAWSTTPQNLPFVVRTTPTTINGVSVPAGVYMEQAYIANGTITNAKIGNAAIDDAKIANIDAGKITTGYLDAGRIEAGSITAQMIDSRGLSIKDANGNVILAAGTPLAVENISGLGDLARFSAITVSNISDVGALASLDEVTAENLASGLAGTIDGKVENWFQSTDPSLAWTSNDIRTKHLGDMWWKTDEDELYRYAYVGNQYVWSEMTSQTAKDAFSNASTAQDTADRKRQVFVAQPTTPYNVGDLWDRGSTTGIWRCNTERLTGNFVASDWQVIADKTGSNQAASISNQGNFATLDQITGANVSTYIASAAIGFAYIADDIQSSDYNAGSAGWKIAKGGAMEMNNATFRGTLDVGAASGNRLNITSDKIEVWEDTTLRVRLGNLS